jgi:hypothetical protein
MSNVVHLRPQGRPHPLAPEAARLLAALEAELARCPPKPVGLTACVAWLQEPAAQLPERKMALRAMEQLRASLFTSSGRQAEMDLLWREAVATACFARLIAVRMRADAPLLTGAGLLHRVGEITAVRALAIAEASSGQRLVGPVMQQIMEAQTDELVSRVTRTWGLAGELRLTLIRWRDEQDSLQRPQVVTLLMMAQALATELVHAATCTPGLVEVAQQSLGLPADLVPACRAETAAIQKLLDHLAPGQA